MKRRCEVAAALILVCCMVYGSIPASAVLTVSGLIDSAFET